MDIMSNSHSLLAVSECHRKSLDSRSVSSLPKLFSEFIYLLHTICNSMFYILGFQVDKHELYRPSNVPRRGSFVKALVATVRIIAYKYG